MIAKTLLADNMLGRLAKWLRFMGHDVLYPKSMDDKDLIALSRLESRLLLTRDKELAKVKDLDVVYIRSENLDEQLKQLVSELNLSETKQEFNRCPECNEFLKFIDKGSVINKVPPGVYENQEEFWYCKNCKKYFWKGTHYKKIKDKIDELYNLN
jgi:uncharacterized protein with PIN domain